MQDGHPQPSHDRKKLIGDSTEEVKSATTRDQVYTNAAPQTGGVKSSSGQSALGTESTLSLTPVQMNTNSQGATTQQGQSSQPTPTNTQFQNFPQPLSPQKEPKWLLVCIRPHKLPTSLSHLDASPVFNDKAFFRNIRETYYNLKSPWHSWLSLKSVTAIKFIRVRQSLFLCQAKPNSQISYSSQSTTGILLILNYLFLPYLH